MAERVYKPFYHHLESPNAEAIKARFWEKVEIANPEDCWRWTAKANSKGYGFFKIASYHQVAAHRLSWAIHNRRDPGELLTLHNCDNPQCVNPVHLRLGTDFDNMEDKMSRGRHRNGDRKGAKNGANKLDLATLAQVIAGFQIGLSNTEIANRLGVSHATISLIRLGKSWTEDSAKLGWKPTPKFKRAVSRPSGERG